jgi:hypothetical protein
MFQTTDKTAHALIGAAVIIALCGMASPVASAAPMTVTGLDRGPDEVSLHWHGGTGPYVIDTLSAAGRWSALGDPFPASPATVPAFAQHGLYRVVDLDSERRLHREFGLVQTDQGEFGSLFARHRLKTRIWLYTTTSGAHAAPTFTAASYFRQLIAVRQYLDGDTVRTWTGPLESLGTVTTPTSTRMHIDWSEGTGATQRSFLLSLTFPYPHSGTRTSAPLASDPRYELTCTYAAPQPEFEETINGLVVASTTVDQGALYQLDPGNPQATFPQPRKYTVLHPNAKVDLHFHEGVPLLEGSPPFIWKTFILDRWLSPTTASGTSLPAFRTDSWFARTLKPGHHNFVEFVLIEPALDPSLAETTRAELKAANIRFLYTLKDLDIGISPDEIRFIGFDNSVREP